MIGRKTNVFDFQTLQEDKHHFLMQCFSDRINENVMYDARDVDKMLSVSGTQKLAPSEMITTWPQICHK